MPEMKRVSRTDAEILTSMRESARDELLFFSNQGKEERERWVVSQFLQHRSLNFLETELRSPHQCSKTDVQFRDANFQVKEIVNPGTRRNDEIGDNYERLMAAGTLEDVIGTQFVYDVPPATTIYTLVSGEAGCVAIKQKYSTIKHELDLLFYVTRTHASPVRKEEIDAEFLASLGWRSISCLAGTEAIVLFAQADAPAFLRFSNDA
jgi:hypothetical protein